MTLIDAHSHFFSYDYFKALTGQMSPAGDVDKVLDWLGASGTITPPPKDLEEHTAQWLAQMDANGVSQMVSFASLPQEAGTVAEAARLSKGRIIPYTLVNPLQDNAGSFLQTVAATGHKGLILFPVMHHFRASDDRVYPLYSEASRLGLVVVCHFGLLQVKLRDLIGLPRVFNMSYGNPLDLHRAANAFREVTFVIPHFGCGFLRETLMLGTLCENVWVDTSSSNSWMSTQAEDLTLAKVFQKVHNVFGADRILFGTDSGMFPRGWRKDLFLQQKEAVKAAGISEAEQEKIFGGNAKRLLKL